MDAATDALLLRIQAKVRIRGPEKCWVWTGTTLNRHTPAIMWRGKRQRVTRILLGLKIGRELRADEEARRECSNTSKLCVNPDHLYVKRLP